MHVDNFPFLAVIAFTAIALAIDLRSRRIPNWLTVSAAITGLLFHVIKGYGTGAVFSLGGFATGFGVLCILWLIGGGGGGDVKLMGAVGAWLGATQTMLIFIGSAGFAIICAVALILRRYQIRSTNTKDSRQGEDSMLRQTIPYAVPVTMSIWTLFVFQCIQS